MSKSIYLAAAMLAALTANAAQAGTKLFTGTRSNVDSPGAPAARCGARTTITIRPGPNSTSVGTSNLGAFTPLLSHCIQLPPPGPFDLGEFTFDFGAGNTLFGTYDGLLSAVSPGLFAIEQDHVITGGTGKYLGATGSFASAGTLSFAGGRPSVQQSFEGSVTAAGIPEPAAWALMIGGFGMAGAALRRRTLVPALV